MEDLQRIIELIQKDAGINLTKYRPSFLKDRLKVRIESTGQKNLASYSTLLRREKDEVSHLINDLNIQASWFFRNGINWSLLSEIILPQLIDSMIRKKEKLIRIWSAGCSRGEEPYTMAILLKEFLAREGEQIPVLIFATDVCQDSLSRAKQGIYGMDAVKNVPFGLLSRYFDRFNDQFQIKSNIKEIVHLSNFDLLGGKHFSPPEAVYANFNIVMCQNVLLYYQSTAQQQIFAKLLLSVSKGGYLVLGKVEEPVGGQKTLFRKIFNIGTIYEKL